MKLLLALTILCLALSSAVSAAAEADGNPCTGAEVSIKAIQKALDRNAYSDADSLVAPLANTHPDCPFILLAQARIKNGSGAIDQARSLFSQYLERVPDDAAGMAYFARFLIDQGEYRQADSLSAAALDRDPNDAAALAVRGQILDMKRQTVSGLELLKKSCELDPDNAEAQFQLGAIYDRAKRPAEAVEHFQKAVDLDPAYVGAWDYLALNLEPLGEMDRTDAAYRHGLAVNHEGPHFDAFLDYNYGRFLAKRNQLAESKKHLDRAVELVPDYRATWYERAKVNMRMGTLPQARTDAEKALSLSDQTGGVLDLQVYGLLEQTYRRLGEKDLADKYAQLIRDTPVPVRKGYEPPH